MAANLILRFGFVLRLEHTLEIFCQRRFIFRAARIELQRKPDLRGLIDNFGPEVNGLLTRQLNFQRDELFNFNVPAREYEAAIATDIGDRGVLARERAFPAGW